MTVLRALNLVAIVLIFANVTKCEDCVLDYRTRENSYEEDVFKHVKCHYRYIIRFLDNNSSKTDVIVRHLIRHYSIDDQEEIFTTQAWRIQQWNEPKIKWDPDDYGGVENIVTYFAAIPSLKLMNAAELYDVFEYSRLVPCKIKSNGLIICMSTATFKVPCSAKLTEWPYDSRTCILDFSRWTNGGHVNIKFNRRAFVGVIGAQGVEWTITDYHEVDHFSNDVELRLTVTLRRQAAVFTPLIIYPSVILTVLTLSCLVLDVRKNIRLSLVCFSLYWHFYFLSEISIYMPSRGNPTPIIILYYRGSLILTSLTVVLTCILSYLSKKATAPPAWVQSCNGFVSRKFPRWLVWPRWDSEHPICNAEWTNFASIINSACNIIFVIVYMSMYLAFVPRPTPIDDGLVV